jgi:hypothetical protein
MAEQKLSPSYSSSNAEISAKPGSGKRAVLYTRVSTGALRRRCRVSVTVGPSDYEDFSITQ